MGWEEEGEVGAFITYGCLHQLGGI